MNPAQDGGTMRLGWFILFALAACSGVSDEYKACGCELGQICLMDPFEGDLSVLENVQNNGTCREVPADCSGMFMDEVLLQTPVDDTCREALCPGIRNVGTASSEGGEHLVQCNRE